MSYDIVRSIVEQSTRKPAKRSTLAGILGIEAIATA